MGLKRQFATDKALEQKGIVLDYGDVRVRIARAGGANQKFARILDAKTRPVRRAIAAGSLDEERGSLLLMEVFAETVVLGWETRDTEGVFHPGISPEDAGESGEDLLPVTPANVVKVFQHLPDFFLELRQQAQASALFRAEVNETLAGN